MFLSTVGGLGYILLATCSSVGVRYFGVGEMLVVFILEVSDHVHQVFLAAAGIFPSSKSTDYAFHLACFSLIFCSCQHFALGTQ